MKQVFLQYFIPDLTIGERPSTRTNDYASHATVVIKSVVGCFLKVLKVPVIQLVLRTCAIGYCA